MNYFGLDLFSLIVAVIAVLIAGFIRGYSGFGFAMVAVTRMSLVIPPARVVPLVLILEVMAPIKRLLSRENTPPSQKGTIFFCRDIIQ